MPRASALVVATLAVGTADAQLFATPFFLSKRSGSNGDGSTWISSSAWHASWGPGADGQMHSHVHEVHSETLRGGHLGDGLHQVRSETVRDDQVLRQQKSQVECHGGSCVEVVQVSQPARAWVPNLRGLIHGRAPPRPPVAVAVAVASPPPKPDCIALVAPARPATVAAADNADVLVMGAAMLACFSGISVALLLKWHQQGTASAREVSMRATLAEPLASEVAHAVPGPAKPADPAASAAGAAKAYLSNLYTSTIGKAQAKAAQMYLLRVYERAAAK